MAALQYTDVPDYSALLLRRSYTDLALPGALMDRGNEWLRGQGPHWRDTEKTWKFPSGATLTFGYLEHDADKYRYQSAEFQYIGFDELTQFPESAYRYMFSRLRRLKGMDVPLRMRAASNPGNTGHEWVKQRFLVEGQANHRIFIPAKLEDNPHLDREEYIESLKELDPITRRQLLDGDWSARQGGAKFQREWFEIVDTAPAQMKRVRYWDMAATVAKAGKDPDATAGALVGATTDGIYYVVDMRHMRGTPQQTDALQLQTAELDGHEVNIWEEQEPGASGVAAIDHKTRRVLRGFTFRGDKVTGSKEVRANPVSSQAEAGNVKLVRGPWINAFLDEVEGFPGGAHDDMVDALSGAMSKLVDKGIPRATLL